MSASSLQELRGHFLHALVNTSRNSMLAPAVWGLAAREILALTARPEEVACIASVELATRSTDHPA